MSFSFCAAPTTRPENLCSLRRFVGRTPWSAADAPVGPVLVAAMLLCATSLDQQVSALTRTGTGVGT